LHKACQHAKIKFNQLIYIKIKEVNGLFMPYNPIIGLSLIYDTKNSVKIKTIKNIKLNVSK